MAQFKIIYYIVLVMSVLLIAVFLWGFFTYIKVKSHLRFLNRPLLAVTLSVAIISLALALVPIGLKVWTYDDDFIKSDPLFLSILILEFVFLISFLILAYVFAFDFGIVLDQSGNTLQFFGQTVNTSRIVGLVEKKFSIKIVYEQGTKNINKKVTIFTPNAKDFVRRILSSIIATNQRGKSLAFDSLNMATKEAGTSDITRFRSKDSVRDREI